MIEMPKKYSSMELGGLVNEAHSQLMKNRKISVKLATNIIWGNEPEEIKSYDPTVYEEALKVYNKHWNDPRVKAKIERNRKKNEALREKMKELFK